MELTGFRSPAPEEGEPNWPRPTDRGGELGYGSTASSWWPDEEQAANQWGPPQGPPLLTGPGQPLAPGRDAWAPPQGPPLAGPGPAHPGGGSGRPKGALRRGWERVLAVLAAVGAFLAKFGAILLKLKYLSLVLSMLVSVAAYAWLWGWTFAVGFVLLIFVHEMGHVVVLKHQGMRFSLPLFIPFLGAFVGMRDMPRNAYQEALSGLAGPYFGVAASIVVAAWGNAIGSNFLLQLAAVGFLLNLFNLMPALPLDGGRAVSALHPAIWFAGLVGLVVYFYFTHAVIVLLVLLLGGFELYRRWKSRNSQSSRAYYALKPQQRFAVGALYVLVVAVALAGFQLTYVARSF
ncbi:MAG TPA: site-2 protease family protein [Acidimicrobiales bacterium]|nr:site-2 protease family protein [Acidimicrobiales bacterium]